MKPIHHMNSAEFDALLAWARYLYWCDLHRRRFEAWLEEEHDIAMNADGWHFIALLSQWYASLWVVIEGWQDVGFDDATIDRLLNDSGDRCEKLRRYRNGTYHYQPRLIEKRVVDFLAESEDTVPWVHALHHEFLRFFDEQLSTLPGAENQKVLRDAVLDMVGWLPDDTPGARMRGLEEYFEQGRLIVAESGDTSPAAQGVLDTITQCRQMANDADRQHRAWATDLVDSVTNKNSAGERQAGGTGTKTGTKPNGAD